MLLTLICTNNCVRVCACVWCVRACVRARARARACVCVCVSGADFRFRSGLTVLLSTKTCLIQSVTELFHIPSSSELSLIPSFAELPLIPSSTEQYRRPNYESYYHQNVSYQQHLLFLCVIIVIKTVATRSIKVLLRNRGATFNFIRNIILQNVEIRSSLFLLVK